MGVVERCRVTRWFVSVSAAYPFAWSSGANGCIRFTSGHVIGIISAVALSFIVHEPSGIMQCTIERSLFASLKMYLQSREEGRAG